MSAIASQITSLTIVYSTVYSGTDQRKHQGSASLAFVKGIHRWPVNSPHKGPVTWNRFPFDDVIMVWIHVGHHLPQPDGQAMRCLSWMFCKCFVNASRVDRQTDRRTHSSEYDNTFRSGRTTDTKVDSSHSKITWRNGIVNRMLL